MFEPIELEEFNKLSRVEKRNHVIQDMWLRYESGLLQFKSVYLKTQIVNTSVKEHVNTTKCEVCLRGGLFCSYVGIANKMDTLKPTIEDGNDIYFYDFDDNEEKTLEIFTKRELAEMELYFEGTDFQIVDEFYEQSFYDELEKLEKYLDEYDYLNKIKLIILV